MKFKRPKPNEPTGEITRSFYKHKVYGTVYVVDVDAGAAGVLAAAVVTEATACRHTARDYALSLDEAGPINAHLADFEFFEPVCSEPKHLLDDIGAQERVCGMAEGDWKQARSESKAAREFYEQERAKLRSMVREATNPRPMPLFDKPSDDAPPPAPPSDQPSA